MGNAIRNTEYAIRDVQMDNSKLGSKLGFGFASMASVWRCERWMLGMENY